MRAKMVRPIALRLTLAESKLLDAWVTARERTIPNSSASDVMRVALVVAGMGAVGRDEWSRIARDQRVAEEWTARIASVDSDWLKVEKRISEAPGSDKDRIRLRENIRLAIDDLLQEHESIHVCQGCGRPITSDDMDKHRECPNCHRPVTLVGDEAPEEIPF
jgi:hypothetical protein